MAAKKLEHLLSNSLVSWLNKMAEIKRKFMAVTMKPELYAKAQEAAAERDIPVTAWVREVVEAELRRRFEE